METKKLDSNRAKKEWNSAQHANEFINRIERQRLDSECLRSLDLRAHVPEPCKRYSYRGRPLWLNPEAHKIFIEGLNNNAGVFTVDTYESILRHFFVEFDEPSPTKEKGDQGKLRAVPQDDAARSTGAIFKSNQNNNNLVIDLSYFERRVYDRFKDYLILGMLFDGKTYTAETRDISQSGLQLRLKIPLELKVNDIVSIDVSPLVDRQLDHPLLDYRVIRCRRLLKDTLLGLQCIEKKEKDGLQVISEHVAAASQSTYSDQSDPEDALLTAQALLAERFYMRSTSILPFFIFETQGDDSPLRIIFSNQANQNYLDVFKDSTGNYDFSPLVTPKRLKLLTRVALRNSRADTMIAVYFTHEQRTPKVIADLECKNHKHWCRLLMRYANQPGFRVFKVVARAAQKPVEMRIEDALEPLDGKDNEFANNLLTDAKNLSIVGALIDLTEQVRSSWHDPDIVDPGSLELPVICQDDEHYHTPPQLVPIHYIQENRSEERYLGQMKVEVIIAGLLYQGVTHDVSAHGLSVELEEPYVAFIHHRQATISFPTLESYSSGRARYQGVFRNVPAEIVGKSNDGEQLLRFKISDAEKGQLFSSTFSALLTKQQSNLCRDNSHSVRAATSRLYSTIFIESTSTLPVFIYRRANDDWTFRLGITTSPTPLIDYFEVADGVYDFTVLTTKNRLQRMMQEASVSGSSEITLYLSKERRGNTPSFVIRSIADFEIGSNRVRDEFIYDAMQHDFRCIKIIVNKPMVPPKAEIEQAIDRLVHLSSSKSKRLKTEFDNLIAIGDMVDTTGLIAEICSEKQNLKAEG